MQLIVNLTSLQIALMSRVSLVLNLQNNLSFAELCLTSLERQTYRSFELLIVADGASSDLIRTLQTRLPLLQLPARMVWSQDTQLSPSRAQQLIATALRSSDADFFVFCESSELFHERFVEEHVRYCTASTILSSRRVELSPSMSGELSNDLIRDGWIENSVLSIVVDGIFGQSTYTLRAIHCELNFWQKLSRRNASDVYGSNFSMHRSSAVQLLNFLDSEATANAQSLRAACGLNILRVRNVIVHYHLNERDEEPLRLVPGMLERVKRFRYSVPEIGLQPAMLEAQRRPQ